MALMSLLAKELSVRYCCISGYSYIMSLECLRSAIIHMQNKRSLGRPSNGLGIGGEFLLADGLTFLWAGVSCGEHRADCYS